MKTPSRVDDRLVSGWDELTGEATEENREDRIADCGEFKKLLAAVEEEIKEKQRERDQSYLEEERKEEDARREKEEAERKEKEEEERRVAEEEKRERESAERTRKVEEEKTRLAEAKKRRELLETKKREKVKRREKKASGNKKMLWWIVSIAIFVITGVLIIQSNGIMLSSTTLKKQSTGFASGKFAPDFNLKKIDGGMAKLSDYSGKVIILDFWATWCPPCIKEIPDFVELQKEYGDKGLIILGISLDQNPKQALPKFIKKYKVNYPILLTDGKVDKSYGGVTGIPTTFIINRKGEIYKRYVGFRPKNVFEEDIRSLLN